MLIYMQNGKCLAGPLDVICILKDLGTGRFHPAFFEEYMLPGPVVDPDQVVAVRLRSKMHHILGFASLEEAVAHVKTDLLAKIDTPSTNVCLEPIDWNGDLGVTWVCSNWLKNKENFSQKVLR